MVVKYFCDRCGKQITDGLVKGGQGVEDFCSRACMNNLEAPEECAHEDNISDAAAGKDTVRLICRDCGYDRTVEAA